MNKKVLLILIPAGLLIIGAILVLILSDFSESDQPDLNELAMTNSRLRELSFELCRDNDFAHPDCAEIFHEFAEPAEFNPQTVLLDFADIFYINATDNQDLHDYIFALPARENKYSINEQDWSEFADLTEHENINKYLADYDLRLTAQDDVLLLSQGDDDVNRFIYDRENGAILCEFLKNDKTLNLADWDYIVKTSAYLLAQAEREELSLNTAESYGEQANYLLLGLSGIRVDSMILLNVNFDQEKITTISIPRDIWLGDYRINLLYHVFGMDYFLTQIEEITGRQIDHYAMVDMFIFPELVDALGGLDYYFSAPLIDPTYRTVDDGEEGTLYFSVGEHHLNGIQALRVARSRHTSNDFSRSRRQHEIFQAIREQINQSGAKMTLLRNLPSFMEKIQTDMSFLQIFDLYLKTKDYKINAGHVMSTKNVLEQELVDIGAEVPAYTLKPRDDDWSLLPKFISNAINQD